MGFFGDLGNWLWEGVILNIILGAGAGGVLFLGWGLLYLVLAYVAENEVYRGLMTKNEDNPLSVVLLCLLTPPLVIGVLGLGVGLLIATLENLILFCLNLIPFTMWGENDAFLHIEHLRYLADIPVLFYRASAYYAMALPLLSGLMVFVLAVVSFGYLFPSGENRGSLGDSNRQYAALSIAMFLALFSLFIMASFSSTSAWMYEYEVEQYKNDLLVTEDTSTDVVDLEDEWMPNYSYQSFEGREQFSDDGGWDAVREVRLDHGNTGVVNLSTGPRAIECLSLNSLSDELDAFHYEPLPLVDEAYHVRIISERHLPVYSLTATHQNQPTQTAHLTSRSPEFHTREIAKNPGEGYRDVGFIVGISLEDNETFASAMYHLVYVYAPDGITSNTTASLDEFVIGLKHQQDCDVVSFTGALEPRVRLSSLFYGVSGMFLFGCVFHRYFIITGRDGTTEPSVLFRTFVQSQSLAVVLYTFLLFVFDPLDGTGVTGLRKEWIVEVTFFAGKVGILLVLLALIGILGAALYRQRGNIGAAMTAMVRQDQELTRIEREWFGNGQ